MPELLLFAMAKEIVGVRSLDVSGSTVGDMLDEIEARHGEPFSVLLRVSKLMVDGEPADRNTPVVAGSEVAVLPPVSGGSDEPRVALLTISDRVSKGAAEDLTGPAVEEVLAYPVAERVLCSDDRDEIESCLRDLCARGFALVLTNGGTGLSPRDNTPEATAAVVERLVPGLAEQMRFVGRDSTPMAMLSRQVVGVRGSALIVNLPGSPKGAVESLSAIASLLPHALSILGGGDHVRV